MERNYDSRAKARQEDAIAMVDVLVANVAEPGDIVLLAIVLVMTVVVGSALLALDAVVGRLRAKRREAPDVS